MNNVLIEKIDTEIAKNKITPALIYNRPDLFSNHYCYYKVTEKEIEQYAAVIFEEKTATLAAWLVPISEEATKALACKIFAEHKEIKSIRYEYICHALGLSKRKDHYRIELPKTSDELKLRLSQKGRYNIRREKRILSEALGGYEFCEATVAQIPETVVKRFFEMKEKTHGVKYKLTVSEFLDKYHVTHAYWIVGGDNILAIIFSCEQCPVIYIENITYDQQYSQYSVGQIIYDLYLERLIEKGYGELFLAGGDLDYKKRYGSIKDEAYVGIVYRNGILTLIARTKNALRTIRDKIKGAK